jgi:hypothetical protein
VGCAVIAPAALLAAPAMAQGCSGVGCDVSGTINISTALVLTSNVTNFTLTNANVGTTDTTDSGTFTVQSNDVSGYYLDIQGPTSFGAFPTTDVAFVATGDSNNGGEGLTTEAQVIGTSSSPSADGGDSVPFGGFYLPSLPGTSGSGTGTVDFTLWGN